MGKKISVSALIVICILVALVSFMTAWSMTRNAYMSELKQLENIQQNNFLQKMQSIYGYFNRYYVNEIDDAQAQENALKGYVLGMGDRYGYYYTKDEYEDLTRTESGMVCGIGVMVTSTQIISDEGLKIEHVIPSSPAENSGIKSEDRIISVDGTSVIGMDYTEASSLIKGDAGTQVSLELKRNGEILNISLNRGIVESESVIYDYLKNEKIGFVRIITFDETTEKQFADAVKSLKASGAEKFIFDLRDNPGGLLTAIIGVSESLLPKDSLVVTSRASDGSKKEYKTKEGSEFNYPCAVLVNSSTASAAELFTAVMRDHKNALIIGETTYGKGVMQSVIQLPDESAIKLTTSYYDPPCGENYDGVGIVPNVEAKLEKDERIDYYSVNTEETVIKTAIAELLK